MWDVRRQVSLLLDHGHPYANRYAIGRVFEEARLVVERLNGLEATRAVLTQMAVASLLSKDAGTGFKNLIASLT